jgi:cell division protein FtsQ
MWFNRKAKNRRLGREHVLDVKLRSNQVRAARLRITALVLGVLFAVVLGLFVLFRAGDLLLKRLVYENPAFALQDMQIQTDGVIATEQIRRWAGIRQGENLLAMDLARVKRNLELAPVLQSASVERVLPHTLRLRVVEREPLAQVAVPRLKAGGGLEMSTFFLDEQGAIMAPLDPRQRAAGAPPPTEQLPQISGIPGNEVQVGRRLDTPQLRAALHLIVGFEHSTMAGWVDLKKIDVSANDVLVVTTGQSNVVTFGLSEPDQQLRRWREIFELGQRLSKNIAMVDLAITNNIPVHWADAGGPATPISRTPKPFHNRKKHV